MTQEKDSLASPCIGVCKLDESDVCLGCYRSLKEIRVWMHANDKKKAKILEKASQRATKSKE